MAPEGAAWSTPSTTGRVPAQDQLGAGHQERPRVTPRQLYGDQLGHQAADPRTGAGASTGTPTRPQRLGRLCGARAAPPSTTGRAAR